MRFTDCRFDDGRLNGRVKLFSGPERAHEMSTCTTHARAALWAPIHTVHTHTTPATSHSLLHTRLSLSPTSPSVQSPAFHLLALTRHHSTHVHHTAPSALVTHNRTRTGTHARVHARKRSSDCTAAQTRAATTGVRAPASAARPRLGRGADRLRGRERHRVEARSRRGRRARRRRMWTSLGPEFESRGVDGTTNDPNSDRPNQPPEFDD